MLEDDGIVNDAQKYEQRYVQTAMVVWKGAVLPCQHGCWQAVAIHRPHLDRRPLVGCCSVDSAAARADISIPVMHRNTCSIDEH